MKDREIKSLHEVVYSQYHHLLQYSNRILDGMPEAAMNQITETKRNITKAEQVKQAYDAAQWYNFSSEGCYSAAIEAAHELGGIAVYNSNDGNRSISFAPTRTFEFDDLSSAHVTYGGVFL